MTYMKPSLTEAKSEQKRAGFKGYSGNKIRGPRHIIPFGSECYPQALCDIAVPPECLYLIGNPHALREGIAVIGARKATPYGLQCARMFSSIAADHGISIISGGAYGCDAAAHKAAIEHNVETIAFLGGGCDQPYPSGNVGLFQDIVDSGGAIVSEHEWDYPPLPFAFRARNRLIAGLAKATLIVEAGLPSGTFSTADEALAAGKDVLVVPGSISSPTSLGSNQLLFQGAQPVVSKETFTGILFDLFGCLLQQESGSDNKMAKKLQNDPLLSALMANPMRMDEIIDSRLAPANVDDPRIWIVVHLAELERDGVIARYPDGRYGPSVF